MSGLTVTAVADGVHLAETGLVNWVILTEGDTVTLVDAGYPGQLAAVERSVRMLGHRPEQIDSVLVTHAHVDHIGTVAELHRRYECRVLSSAEEARHIRGEYHQSATVGDVVVNAWRPRVLVWGLKVARVGATKKASFAEAVAIPADTRLDLPSRPIALATPGHTSGHTAYLLADVGVIILGDALVTGHPTVHRRGPQLLLPFFHHDVAQVRATVDRLRHVDADAVLTGHGPVVRQALADVVDRALR